MARVGSELLAYWLMQSAVFVILLQLLQLADRAAFCPIGARVAEHCYAVSGIRIAFCNVIVIGL
jgi:hypothetical protein